MICVCYYYTFLSSVDVKPYLLGYKAFNVTLVPKKFFVEIGARVSQRQAGTVRRRVSLVSGSYVLQQNYWFIILTL